MCALLNVLCFTAERAYLNVSCCCSVLSRLADDVLLAGVRSVTDLMVNPGLINLDFADVQVCTYT